MNTELIEAGEMTGASRSRVLRDITLPIILPAVASSALLVFAVGVSNFAAPALLGLPVRFETLSTRIFGMIRIGQLERGYMLTIILILIAALLLWGNSRMQGRRRSYATLTGKGSRRKRQSLGVWRWPLFIGAFALATGTTILPLLTLMASSLARHTDSLTSGFSLHYWIGESNPDIAHGQAGILRNPQILDAGLNTLVIGFTVAIIATFLGLLIGYAVVKAHGGRIGNLIGSISYIPFFIPGVAFAAVYIAQFGSRFGPIPPLYGTMTLLILAGAAYTLPFVSESGRATMSQISGELEEAAAVAGARFPRRVTGIMLPLASRGLIAGAVLVFVKIVRDLSLMVLLTTPFTATLSVVAFRYASDGFTQFANAITVIIAAISIAATLLARRLQGASQPWAEME